MPPEGVRLYARQIALAEGRTRIYYFYTQVFQGEPKEWSFSFDRCPSGEPTEPAWIDIVPNTVTKRPERPDYEDWR